MFTNWSGLIRFHWNCNQSNDDLFSQQLFGYFIGLHLNNVIGLGFRLMDFRLLTECKLSENYVIYVCLPLMNSPTLQPMQYSHLVAAQAHKTEHNLFVAAIARGTALAFLWLFNFWFHWVFFSRQFLILFLNPFAWLASLSLPISTSMIQHVSILIGLIRNYPQLRQTNQQLIELYWILSQHFSNHFHDFEASQQD